MRDHLSRSTRRSMVLVGALVVGHLVLVAPAAAEPPAGVAAAPVATVTAIPAPGTSAASPDTAVTLRWDQGQGDGDAAVTSVRGSVSGAHPGRVQAHPDGHGVTFHPDQRFSPGEIVAVTTSAPVAGGDGTGLSFTVATPGVHPGSTLAELPDEEAGGGSVGPTAVPEPRFASRPDLRPPAVTVNTSTGGAAAGLVFATPSAQSSRGVDAGVMVYDDAGELVYFRPNLVPGTVVGDAHVAEYLGAPSLVWYEGIAPYGAGNYRGEWVVADTSYREVARIRMGNGYQADIHDIRLTDEGTAYLLAYNPVLCSGHAPLHTCRQGATVLEAVVQEVDLRTGVVLWEWHSLDHVPLADTYVEADVALFDYIHANSLDLDDDGAILMSARTTSALYKIDRATGDVVWTFGGRRTSFPNLVNEPETIQGPDFPHHFISRGGGTYSYFDNGSRRRGPSRGAIVDLDPGTGTATYTDIFIRDPQIFANTQGAMQGLPGGHELVAWGGVGTLTEYGPGGEVVLDASLVGSGTYRQLRHVWEGAPTEAPAAVRTTTSGGSPGVAVSWNGDTRTASWRVRAGASPNDLAPVATAARSGFETVVEVPDGAGPWVAVEALGPGGTALGRSEPIAGSALFEERTYPGLAGATAPIVGDFAGSRNDDIIDYQPGGAPDVLRISDGDGGDDAVTLPSVGHVYTPIVGDFVGDDRDEVLWWRPGIPTAYLWRFDLRPRGNTPVTASSGVTMPVTTTRPLVLDHRPGHGGGSDELLWYAAGSGPDRADHFTWGATGPARVASRPLSVLGNYAPVTGDFDGNGLADVLWYAPGAGRESIWFHRGGPDGTTGHRTTTMHVNATYEVLVGNLAGNEVRDEIFFHGSGGAADYLWTFEADGRHRSLPRTTATEGRAVVLGGPRDLVLTWGSGSPRVGRYDGPAPVVEPTGNTAVALGATPAVGGFTGPGDRDSLVWPTAGAGPDPFWVRP